MIFKPKEVTAGDIPCEIIKRIPGGSMAELYLARIQHTQYQAVIKAVALEKDSTKRQALAKEAELLGGLYHRHIPTILDAVQEEHRQYYVMSYHDGMNLEGYRRTCEQISEEQIFGILQDIGSVLAYLHQKGIFHGDIKPSNILLDRTQAAFLLDFGTADFFDTYEKGVRFRGTLGYAAPECWHGQVQRLTPAADIFALGATLYFLLEGREPRDAYGHFILHDTQKKNRWQPVLDKCCTLNKEKRFQSAAELLDYTAFAM